MRILFLTTVLPSGRGGGGEIVSQGVVEALRAGGHDVAVVGYSRPGRAARAAPGELSVGERPIETSAAGMRAPLWMARALSRAAPYSVAKYVSRGYLRAVRDALGARPSAVVADHAQVHFALAGARNLPPLVFVAHNAEAEVYGGLAKSARTPWSRWANAREASLIGRAETELAGRAGQTWVLTSDDAAYFQRAAPAADVRTLAVASALAPPGRAQPRCDVALIGNWTWSANARGLEWFAREVLPLLPADMTVEVAGAGAGWLDGRDARVTVRGVVPDAAELMAGAGVVAVPSVTGGGVQVKTLDALAIGAPVVATETAVRGLADLPSSVAVANEPDRFAAALRRLAPAPDRERLRDASLAWSRDRRQGFDTCVAAWIGELAGERRTAVPS